MAKEEKDIAVKSSTNRLQEYRLPTSKNKKVENVESIAYSLFELLTTKVFFLLTFHFFFTPTSPTSIMHSFLTFIFFVFHSHPLLWLAILFFFVDVFV